MNYDARVRHLTPEQQAARLHTLPVWARERIARLERTLAEIVSVLDDDPIADTARCALLSHERDDPAAPDSDEVGLGADPIMGALAFFASCIRCGEPWDDICQRAYDRAAALLLRERERAGKWKAESELWSRSRDREHARAEAAEARADALARELEAARKVIVAADAMSENYRCYKYITQAMLDAYATTRAGQVSAPPKRAGSGKQHPESCPAAWGGSCSCLARAASETPHE